MRLKGDGSEQPADRIMEVEQSANGEHITKLKAKNNGLDSTENGLDSEDTATDNKKELCNGGETKKDVNGDSEESEAESMDCDDDASVETPQAEEVKSNGDKNGSETCNGEADDSSSKNGDHSDDPQHEENSMDVEEHDDSDKDSDSDKDKENTPVPNNAEKDDDDEEESGEAQDEAEEASEDSVKEPKKGGDIDEAKEKDGDIEEPKEGINKEDDKNESDKPEPTEDGDTKDSDKSGKEVIEDDEAKDQIKEEVKDEVMETDGGETEKTGKEKDAEGEETVEVKEEVSEGRRTRSKDVKVGAKDDKDKSTEKDIKSEDQDAENSGRKDEDETPCSSEKPSTSVTPADSKEGTPVREPVKEAKYKMFEKCGTDTEDMRPMAKMLYALGADLCKQMIYKDLIRVQDKKKSLNKLDEKETTQLEDLKDEYDKLQAKNKPYLQETSTCSRCAFKSESINIVEWHKEFAHNQEDGLYSCSFCDFESKFPGQFFYHMEAIHNRKGRIYMRPSFFNCPMCPFENSTKASLKKHLLKCEKTFSLKRNLEPAPTDCDIPLKKPKAPPAPKKPPPKPTPPVSTPKLPQIRPASRQTTPNSSSNSSSNSMRQPNMQQQFQQLAQRMGAPGISLLPQTGLGQAPTYAIGNQVFTLVNNQGQFMLQPTGATVPGFSSMAGMRMPMMNPTMMAQQAAAVNQAMLQLQAQHAANAKAMAKSKSTPPPAVAKATPPPKPAKPPVKQPTPNKPRASPSGPGKKSQFEICEICGGFVKDRESLRIHFYWAHKVDINKEIFERKEPHLACNACPQRFWTYQGYRWHQRMKHNNTSMPEQPPGTVKQAPKYFCAVCRSHTITNLLLHLLEVHRISVDMVCEQKRCPMCGVTFKTPSNTRHHLYNSHKDMFRDAPVLEGKKPGKPQTTAVAPKAGGAPVPTGIFENAASRMQAKFEPVCSICDLTFPNVEAFTLHCNRNHVFNCYRCGTKWSTADQLNNHFNREHRFEQERCQLCDDKVTIGRPYVRHVKRSHLKECSVRVQRLSRRIVENIRKRYAGNRPFKSTQSSLKRNKTGLRASANQARKMGPKSKTQRPPEEAITIDDEEEDKTAPEKPASEHSGSEEEQTESTDKKDTLQPDQELLEIDGETIIIQKSTDDE